MVQPEGHTGQVLMDVPDDRYSPPQGRPIVDDIEEMEQRLHQQEAQISNLQHALMTGLATSEAIEHALEEQVHQRDLSIQAKERDCLLLKAGVIRVIEQLNTMLPENKRANIPNISMSAKGVLQHLEEVKNLLRTEYIL